MSPGSLLAFEITNADPRLQYTKQKGFYEDLDEGKYSLPLIHALGQCGNTAKDDALLRNLLSQRHVARRMSIEQKQLFLEYLNAQGSLDYTRLALDALQFELKDMAGRMGMFRNAELKDLMEVLKVSV